MGSHWKGFGYGWYVYSQLFVKKKRSPVSEFMYFCSCTGDAAKAAWKVIRDQFVRELKKVCRVVPHSGMDAPDDEPDFSKVVWPYFRSLLFIKDSVTPRKTKGNIRSVSTLVMSSSY